MAATTNAITKIIVSFIKLFPTAHRDNKNDCDDYSYNCVTNNNVHDYFSNLKLIVRQETEKNKPTIKTEFVTVEPITEGIKNPRTVEAKRILERSERYFERLFICSLLKCIQYN